MKLKSSASASEKNGKDLCLFCAMLEELQATYKDPLLVQNIFRF